MRSVSVAMATYNGDRFLKEQLDSIARQSYLPDELVVCDDRSQDETVAILERFAVDAPFPVRIHCNEERLGFGDNFLRATSYCGSDLIAFCDQDDVWLEDKLLRCVTLFEDPRCRLVVHSAAVVSESLHPLGRNFPSMAALRAVRSSKIVPWFEPPGFAMVFAADLLRMVDMFDRPHNCQTVGLVMPHDTFVSFLASAVGGLVPLAEPLVLYRQHGSSVSGAPEEGLKAKLAAARETGSDQYDWAAELAAEYSAFFARQTPFSTEDRRAFERASTFYAKLSEIQSIRSAIYRSNTSRLERLTAVMRMASKGGYLATDRRGEGCRSLAKDIVVALSGHVP